MNSTTNTNSVIDDFSKWKSFLGEKVEQAHSVGMSDQQIQDVAVHLGGYLSNKIDPANSQERLLKQMWDVCPESDRKVLARCMVNLVQGQSTTTH